MHKVTQLVSGRSEFKLSSVYSETISTPWPWCPRAYRKQGLGQPGPCRLLAPGQLCSLCPLLPRAFPQEAPGHCPLNTPTPGRASDPRNTPHMPELCDLGQVPSFLWASVSSCSMKTSVPTSRGSCDYTGACRARRPAQTGGSGKPARERRRPRSTMHLAASSSDTALQWFPDPRAVVQNSKVNGPHPHSPPRGHRKAPLAPGPPHLLQPPAPTSQMYAGQRGSSRTPPSGTPSPSPSLLTCRWGEGPPPCCQAGYHSVVPSCRVPRCPQSAP